MPDIQIGLGASASDASWITTLYSAATFIAFALSPLLVRTFGIRRLFLASAGVFAVAAAIGSFASSLPLLLAARTVQGFAGGMFGPMAFVAIFRMWSGPRLPLGFALLALVLLVSFNSAPVFAAPIEAAFGWRALFLAQAALAVPLIFAGMRWMPAGGLNWNGHSSEWLQLVLLAAATGSLAVVVGQGPGRGWFDSPLVVWTVLASVATWIGFVMAHRGATVRVLDGGKLLDRRFGIPIALNFVFRASFAATVYVLPLLLPDLGAPVARGWLLLAQLAAFPIVWRWLQGVDARVPMALGLLSTAAGIALAASGLLPSLGLIGAGQVFFLVPALMTGAGSLKPQHGPTATILFNMTTAGGTTLGIGLLSTFVSMRTAVHALASPALEEAMFLVAIVLVLVAPAVALIGPPRTSSVSDTP